MTPLSSIIKSSDEDFKNYKCPYIFDNIEDDVQEQTRKYKRRLRIFNSSYNLIPDEMKKEMNVNKKYSKNHPIQNELIKMYCYENRKTYKKYSDDYSLPHPEIKETRGRKLGETSSDVKPVEKPYDKNATLNDIFDRMNDNTKYCYKSIFNKMYKTLYGDKINDYTTCKFLLDDEDNVLRYIYEICYTDYDRTNILKVILKMLIYHVESDVKSSIYKNIYKMYRQMFNTFRSNEKYKYLEHKTIDDPLIINRVNNPTIGEIRNWVEYPVIRKSFKDHQDKLDDVTKLIVALSIYMIGRTEKRELTILDNKEKMNESKNYIDLDNNTIILNKYKTDIKYGQSIQVIPDKLRVIIDEYINNHNLNKGDLLLTKQQSLDYLKILKAGLKILTKKIIDYKLLRKIYVTYLWGAPRNIQQMTNDSIRLAHSIEEQLNTYIRIIDLKE